MDYQYWNKRLSGKQRLFRRLQVLFEAISLTHLANIPSRKFDYIDISAIVIKMLDLVIQYQDISDGGISKDQLIDLLIPLVQEMDLLDKENESLEQADYEYLINHLLRKLTTLSDPKKQIDYTDFSTGIAIRASDRFPMLRKHPSTDGEIIIRAEPEAINLFGLLLETPLESKMKSETILREHKLQQNDAEGLLEILLDSINTTKAYVTKVGRDIKHLERKIDLREWEVSINPTLTTALNHVTDTINFLQIDHRIITQKIEINLHSGRSIWYENLDLTNDHLQLLIKLQHRIRKARSTFLTEQRFYQEYGLLSIDSLDNLIWSSNYRLASSVGKIILPLYSGIKVPKFLSLEETLLKGLDKISEYTFEENTFQKEEFEEFNEKFISKLYFPGELKIIVSQWIEEELIPFIEVKLSNIIDMMKLANFSFQAINYFRVVIQLRLKSKKLVEKTYFPFIMRVEPHPEYFRKQLDNNYFIEGHDILIVRMGEC